MMYGGGGYYNQGRQLEPFRSTPSARSSIQRETERLLRESLQGAAEYARQNDPMARAVIGRSEDLVVGQDGPRVEWDTGDAEWDTLAGRLWERYFHDVGPGTMDAQGLVAGPQLLRQSHSAVYVSGRYAWLGTGLADDGEADDATGGITLVDGVRIINPGASLDSDECVAGVQLDGRGRLAGVNVADWAHGGMHLDYATTLYDRCFGYVPNPLATELGMIAPPPALAVALVSITQLQSVLWSVVHAVNKEAGENIAVKTTDPDDDLFEGSASRDPDAPGLRVGRDGRLEHGLGADGYTRLAPGEELVGVASNYPQQALEPFIRSMLIQVGAPFGITYEMLTGDFRGSNFSAAKLSMQLTGRRIGVMQSSMASMLLRPVIARVFIPAMILKGELDAARLPEGWDRPEITPAPLPDPDPQKTAVRVLTDLRTGMRTQRDNARERGQTLEEYRRELADDAAFLDSISVVNPMGSDPSAAETPAAVADLVSDEVPGERAGGPEAGGGGRGENATDPGNPADATGHAMIYAYDTGRGLIARATIRGEIVGGEPDRELIESWEPYAQVDEIARFCDSVREDEDVAGVVLAFDSPGGSVLRLTHAVRAVHALSVAKPTLAYVDERAASAAYWIASQCRAIWAASTLSQVGAIGARQELMSEAGRLERQGVAVETVFRGDGKDVPDSSRAISDADREQVGRLLDPIYDAFVADVAVGRSLTDEQVRAIGARVYPAAEAVEIGLVDDIVPANGLDRTFAERVLGMDAADAAVLAAG